MTHLITYTPFPRWLRWALLAPLAGFVLAMFIPAMFSPLFDSNTMKGVALLLLAVAGFIEILAVPTAVVMLLRDRSYLGVGNVVVTLVAAIPVAFVIAVAWVLKYGHFHI